MQNSTLNLSLPTLSRNSDSLGGPRKRARKSTRCRALSILPRSHTDLCFPGILLHYVCVHRTCNKNQRNALSALQQNDRCSAAYFMAVSCQLKSDSFRGIVGEFEHNIKRNGAGGHVDRNVGVLLGPLDIFTCGTSREAE